jgi:hypothetical protein
MHSQKSHLLHVFPLTQDFVGSPTAPMTEFCTNNTIDGFTDAQRRAPIMIYFTASTPLQGLAGFEYAAEELVALMRRLPCVISFQMYQRVRCLCV